MDILCFCHISNGHSTPSTANPYPSYKSMTNIAEITNRLILILHRWCLYSGFLQQMEIGKFVEYKKIFKLYGISEDADKDPHFSLYPENHTVYQQNWPNKGMYGFLYVPQK